MLRINSGTGPDGKSLFEMAVWQCRLPDGACGSLSDLEIVLAPDLPRERCAKQCGHVADAQDGIKR